MTELDELDTAILRELQVDARRTNRDIAAAVGVAPTTALDRTRLLRERGVIRGAVLDVDLAAIGRPVQALLAIRVAPPSRQVMDGFAAWARTVPEALGVFVTTGTEDFLLHVAVQDNASLRAFVLDRLAERSEITDVRTSVIFDHLRNPYVTPMTENAESPSIPMTVRRKSGKTRHSRPSD